MSAQAGIGLLVNISRAKCVVDWVPLGGRVCLLKLRLQERSLCFLLVYAPNIESQYEAFLEEVEVALGKAISSKFFVLLGDFNAHVGIDNAICKGVIGQHGDPDIYKNERCFCLLQFCVTNGLHIMNTFFQPKRIHKYTWYRDSLGQRSLIDFWIVSADLFLTASDVRIQRVVNWSSPSCLHFESFKTLEKAKDFSNQMVIFGWRKGTNYINFVNNFTSKFKELATSTEDIENEWCLFRTAVITSATNCCGRKRVGETKGVAKKELLGRTRKLKKLFERKKWPVRPGLLISHHLNFVRSTLNHVRQQSQKLNCLRKGPGRNLEKG